ncbi:MULTISPECIES: hypothetical protein [Shouchella]|uniref:PEGA domain-containing protein n=2 Tax=Shouchella TaxID=2893057 RepID=A0ABY7W1P8_9BACI|nr:MULTISPECIES: hypothetical protein [Shouchella]MED4128830.1 hypothetical protein [Shouchella miscanthi]WDF01966.1 hypothetical protein PQ477_10560 [Shouchella hunanensis]GAF20390.1 hypothetical protein JCM19047_19 [Bacillus sp. JCM 19047]
MFRSYRQWKRRKKVNKVKEGDGHALKPFRFWQPFTRSLFYLELTGDEGETHVYAVNVHFFSEDNTAELYLDGKHMATSSLPAAFPVPGGVIEVGATDYGLSRMHYVRESDQREYVLQPDKRSGEGLRLRLDQRFPITSKSLGLSAVMVLLVSLILGLPQLLELVTSIPWIHEHIGTFQSPITLPDWVNTTLIVASVLAGIERALLLRNHWLIDMETGYWDS